MLFLCSEQKRKKTDTEYSLFNVRGWVTPLKNWTVKVYIFREGHKFLRNHHLTFDCMYCSQKLGEDFAKFSGLLRIYEL